MQLTAFLTPPGAIFLTPQTKFPTQFTCARRSIPSTTPQMTASPPPKKRNWLRIALVTAAGLASTTVLPLPRRQAARLHHPSIPAAQAAAPSTVVSSDAGVPLRALGIKRDDYVGERELRRRKTTRYSEAEQEIIELEEWEVATQWFRDLQVMWAAFASVGGIFVLYKGGVMWERWIKEQEKKDMEEEIKLTGTFIDPRAVRKDEDDEGGKKDGGKDDKGPEGRDGDSGKPPSSPDYPPDGLESLEKLFGKS